ncbi:MAG: hypothetical protein IJU75_05505 [Clostridia bacterium]|nr:hypothetical protein [Clostridia bacterium]
MKRLFSLVASILILLAFASCSKPQEIMEVQGEALVIPMTFEEIVSAATHIVVAEFTGDIEVSPEGFYSYLKFRPVSLIKGSVSDELISVSCFNGSYQMIDGTDAHISYSGRAYSTSYQSGEQYLLILEKHVMVFYDCDRYIPIGGIFIPKTHTVNASMYGKRLSEYDEDKTEENSNFNHYCERIKKLVENDTSEKTDHLGVDFIKSDSLNDIVPQSDYIFRVTVLDKKGDYPDANNSGYNCRVDEQIKGSTTETIIDVHAFPDSLQVGEQYLMFLTLVGPEGSRMFHISSKNGSVYPASDTAIRDQVDRILSQEN